MASAICEKFHKRPETGGFFWQDLQDLQDYIVNRCSFPVSAKFPLKLEAARAEIDQQPNLNSGRSKVIDQLRLVRSRQRLAGLEFHEDSSFDKHISHKFPYDLPIVVDADRSSAFRRQARL
jgi:hypothetical protein